MYIDIKRQIARTRVAGAISWTGRTVLAGEEVKISSYTDRRGLSWTVATWDLDSNYDDFEFRIQENKIRHALKAYCLNFIRQF